MINNFFKKFIPKKQIYIRMRNSQDTFLETVYGEDVMRLFYGNPAGLAMTSKLLTNRLLSDIYGAYNDSSVSKHKIEKFVSQLNINIDEAEKPISEYQSFNEFFARKLKPHTRPIPKEDTAIISPGDGRILVFPKISKGTIAHIKWAPIELLKLFDSNVELAERYEGGSCAVVRLCPSDYHRFHFPAAGKAGLSRTIPGLLHSVSPYALESNIPVFSSNKRTMCELLTSQFGHIGIMEIGALFVGSIVQTYRAGMAVRAGDEKGYFKFGGSTVVLFFENKRIKFDKDLLQNSAEGFETKVLMGEKIGEKP